MTIYLAAAVTHADRDVELVRVLLECLESQGHAVPTRHLADAARLAAETALTDAALAARDLAWLEESQAVVAEVSTPSHGVGVEVALARQRGTPVLLLAREGARVSKLLLGLPGVTVARYRGRDEACTAIRAFLATVPARSPTSHWNP